MAAAGSGTVTAVVPRASGCLDPTAHGDGSLVTVDPYTALRYHFGMLLGVDDFETEHAYHQGKMRLHNAWLHRAGVVWGLDVVFDATTRELQVCPGFALDAAGRELHLDCVACLDLGAWYEAHKGDQGFDFKTSGDGGGTVRFSAQVVIRFDTCLSRQVPALADPCDGGGASTAYSRVVETVDIHLRPNQDRPADPYHRLRVLFDLEDGDGSPRDTEVVGRRDEILARSLDLQPREYLKAFREFAALDEIDLAPPVATDLQPATIFPEGDDTEVLLADIDKISLTRTDRGWAIAEPLPTVNVLVRPSHVATATIQELLNGPRFRHRAAPGPEAPPDGGHDPNEPAGDPGHVPPAKDAGGDPGQGPPAKGNGAGDKHDPGSPAQSAGDVAPPQASGAIDHDSEWTPDDDATKQRAPRLEFVGRKDKRITLSSSRPLHPASVVPAAFVVAAFHPTGGWQDLEIHKARLVRRGTRIVLELREAEPEGISGIRVFAHGRGVHPVLGLDLLPIAGAIGGPSVPLGSGADFAHMLTLEG